MLCGSAAKVMPHSRLFGWQVLAAVRRSDCLLRCEDLYVTVLLLPRFGLLVRAEAGGRRVEPLMSVLKLTVDLRKIA